MVGLWAYKTRVTISAVCWIALPLALQVATQAATITNYFGASSDWPMHSIAVNVGDTVVWLNQQAQFLGSNYVESFGGEFKSPLMNTGDSFSFTFTNAGFYAYRTCLHNRSFVAGAEATAGTITVKSWTGAPPPLILNTPVDGSVLPVAGRLVQASPTNADGVARIEYFANSGLIGTATNPPFGVEWAVPLQSAPYTLIAKATDRQGIVTWSEPVNVTVTRDEDVVWGPRFLPTGEFLFYYIGCDLSQDYIFSSDDVLFTNKTQLAVIPLDGVFVDERVRGGGIAKRFYQAFPGLP